MSTPVLRPLSSLLRLSKASTHFTVRVLQRLVWPKIDTLIRLGLAQAFCVSGVMKVTHWGETLAAVSHDFPVRFMTPITAAYGGVSVEIVGGVLLALGFMTRYAALALLTLTVTSLVVYGPVDSELCCAALFGWYAVQGAGPFSADAVLRQGLAESALPVVPRIVAGSEWIRTHLTPLYLSLMRIWLALALLVGNSPSHAAERTIGGAFDVAAVGSRRADTGRLRMDRGATITWVWHPISRCAGEPMP
jgi:NADH:quinone reductase (non-electrogenic)